MTTHAHNSNNEIIYKLKVPIVWGSDTITELKFKSPKLKHLKAIDGVEGGFEIIARLVEKLCLLTPPQVDELDPADFECIGEILKTFLPQLQGTSNNT